VPDFIALRGDPSDKIPGARGVGAKTAASLLASTAPRGRARAGRFAAEADALRLYRHVATMDAEAPLPPLGGPEPTWDAPPRSPTSGGWAGWPAGLEALSSS
jgi:DNA polymerase-1